MGITPTFETKKNGVRREIEGYKEGKGEVLTMYQDPCLTPPATQATRRSKEELPTGFRSALGRRR